MRKAILQILLSAFVLAIFMTPVAGQKKKIKTQIPKTREVTIYVYQQAAASSDEFYGSIVPVRRRIVDRQPLSQAIKLLLKGASVEEKKRGLSDFIYELKFESARIIKGEAQIKFKFINPRIAEESWEGGGFDYKNFNLAVEQTARQFPEVERVIFCIEGKQGYTDQGGNGIVKCPF